MCALRELIIILSFSGSWTKLRCHTVFKFSSFRRGSELSEEAVTLALNVLQDYCTSTTTHHMSYYNCIVYGKLC